MFCGYFKLVGVSKKFQRGPWEINYFIIYLLFLFYKLFYFCRTDILFAITSSSLELLKRGLWEINYF